MLVLATMWPLISNCFMTRSCAPSQKGCVLSDMLLHDLHSMHDGLRLQ